MKDNKSQIKRKHGLSKDKKTLLTRSLISIFAIGIIGIIFVIWVIYLYPIVENSPVWLVFLIFYLLIISFWMTLFICIFGFNKKAIKSGSALIIFSAIFDLYYPPPSVNFDGSLSESKGSIDYTLGYYLHILGLGGIIVFLLVYMLIPILVLLTILLILKPKRFFSLIKEEV